MSRPVLYASLIVLTALVLWLAIWYIPGLNRAHIEGNDQLKAANKSLDSALMAKQVKIDSLDATVQLQETRMQTILSDTNRIKIKYIGIKQGVNALSRDSAYLYFLERTR